MRKMLMVAMVSLLGIACLTTGCKKQDPAGQATVSADTQGQMILCAKCGQLKGSDKCCQPDAEKCPVCGLAKGSPACCKGIDFSKGDVKLCPQCGEIAGSPKCCVQAVEKCSHCGMNKGAPGCCIKAKK